MSATISLAFIGVPASASTMAAASRALVFLGFAGVAALAGLPVFVVVGAGFAAFAAAAPALPPLPLFLAPVPEGGLGDLAVAVTASSAPWAGVAAASASPPPAFTSARSRWALLMRTLRLVWVLTPTQPTCFVPCHLSAVIRTGTTPPLTLARYVPSTFTSS